MNHENTNWQQSVAGVCIKGNKVLLARHTYGGGKGKLIIPGGYLNQGEMPEDGVRREFLEETGVKVEPRQLLAIRFNARDWYAVFAADYISGEAVSDHDENSEVLWVDAQEALCREDVPGLTRVMIEKALQGTGLTNTPYPGGREPYTLYCAVQEDSHEHS